MVSPVRFRPSPLSSRSGADASQLEWEARGVVDMIREIDRSGRPREGQIADLAGCQHGVVTRRQLKTLGLGEDAIDSRLAQGRLHRVYRGVYTVGHSQLGQHGRWLAAVLTCGDGALLSHRSGTALWGVGWGGSALVDVTGTGRGQAGIKLHRTRCLHPDDRATRDGIPVTRLPRTLLDVARSVPKRQLERALEQADRLGRLDMAEVEAMLRRTSGHHGSDPSLPVSRPTDPRPRLAPSSSVTFSICVGTPTYRYLLSTRSWRSTKWTCLGPRTASSSSSMDSSSTALVPLSSATASAMPRF